LINSSDVNRLKLETYIGTGQTYYVAVFLTVDSLHTGYSSRGERPRNVWFAAFFLILELWSYGADGQTDGQISQCGLLWMAA